MATIVVGGQARKVGKTSVIAGLIAALPEFRWTAVKLSHHTHDGTRSFPQSRIGGRNGAGCAVYRETDPAKKTDSARFLASGAASSFWVCFKNGHLAEVIPTLMPVFSSRPWLIIESSSIVDHIRADMYIVVLRRDVGDFKKSAMETLARADAVVLVNSFPGKPLWPQAARDLLKQLPVYPANPPEYAPKALVEAVRSRLRLTGPGGRRRAGEDAP